MGAAGGALAQLDQPQLQHVKRWLISRGLGCEDECAAQSGRPCRPQIAERRKLPGAELAAAAAQQRSISANKRLCMACCLLPVQLLLNLRIAPMFACCTAALCYMT